MDDNITYQAYDDFDENDEYRNGIIQQLSVYFHAVRKSDFVFTYLYYLCTKAQCLTDLRLRNLAEQIMN